MRKCTNCGVKQPEEQFYKGGHRQCKACLREKAQKRYQTDGGYEKQKAWQLKTWYGITTEEYEELLLKQSFRCAVCNSETEMCVDHNHTTGEVRGLLCHKCNTAIGLLNDDPKLLELAISYLRKKPH